MSALHWTPCQTGSNKEIHSRQKTTGQGVASPSTPKPWQAQTLDLGQFPEQGQNRRSNTENSKKTGTLKQGCSLTLRTVSAHQKINKGTYVLVPGETAVVGSLSGERVRRGGAGQAADGFRGERSAGGGPQTSGQVSLLLPEKPSKATPPLTEPTLTSSLPSPRAPTVCSSTVCRALTYSCPKGRGRYCLHFVGEKTKAQGGLVPSHTAGSARAWI